MAEKDDTRGQPGIGVDARGGAVVDPTKNVEDLFKAGQDANERLRVEFQRYLDSQLAWSEKFQNFARESEVKFSTLALGAQSDLFGAKLEGETRRIDQLAALRQDFQNVIKDMLAGSVQTNSTLVATQLLQIQSTFNERVTKLEQAQLTQAGRSSVADPAMEAALSRITGAMASLASQMATMQVGESNIGGRTRGMMDSNARLLLVVMAIATVASPIIAILGTIMAMRGH